MFKRKSFLGRLKANGKDSDFDEEEDLMVGIEEKTDKDMDGDDLGELSVDVFQNNGEIIIKAMVAGVKPEDLDVSISRDMVKITGKRETERTIHESNYYQRELYWGSFTRTIPLSEEIDVDEAEAIEKHGLLIITLPKLDKNRQAKIKVRG